MIRQESTPRPAIQVVEVSKAYPGVVALDRVNLSVAFGEIHAVIGLNGAGKSTLINVLAGSLEPDAGTVRVGGTARGSESLANRVSFVPQEILMVPTLSVGRNSLLGSEGFITKAELNRSEYELVIEGFRRVGLDIDPVELPTSCSVPQLRLVQIARALMKRASVILLDEPTAVLGRADSYRLLSTLRTLRNQGEAIVYVSHRLGEILEMADRITVLRDGRAIKTFDRHLTDRDELIEILSGQATHITTITPGMTSAAETFLVVEDLSAPGLNRVSLQARRGEVVALVGVPAGGQSQVVQVLAGLDPSHSGSVYLQGRSVSVRTVIDSYQSGFVLVPADRRHDGIVGSASVLENIVLPPKSIAQQWKVRLKREERRIVDSYVNSFEIITRSRSAAVSTLSGGNQQKVALAKAFEAKPRVLLLDEPTQGIDVASKRSILDDIKVEARSSGRAVLAAMSELEEVAGWADTVYVFRVGQTVARLEGSEVTEDILIRAAVP